jgi:hypothetical protein
VPGTASSATTRNEITHLVHGGTHHKHCMQGAVRSGSTGDNAPRRAGPHRGIARGAHGCRCAPDAVRCDARGLGLVLVALVSIDWLRLQRLVACMPHDGRPHARAPAPPLSHMHCFRHGLQEQQLPMSQPLKCMHGRLIMQVSGPSVRGCHRCLDPRLDRVLTHTQNTSWAGLWQASRGSSQCQPSCRYTTRSLHKMHRRGTAITGRRPGGLAAPRGP